MKKEELVQLGEKLKKAREAKRIDLDQITERTKININFLTKMEQGNFEFLPQLYVRNFLKLYLSQLGVEAIHLLNEYDSITSTEVPKVPDNANAEIKNFKGGKQLQDQILTFIKKFKPYLQQHYIIWFSLGAVIVFVFIYSIAKDTNKQHLVSTDSTGSSLTQVKSTGLNSAPDSSVIEKIVNSQRNLMLELKATEKTWLQVSVDDSVTKELVFDPGMISNWQAKERFRLFIGNAAGIRLFLNGKDLGSLGKPGQVIKVDVTENGIQNSSF